jgi:hypothetical protein
LVQRSNLSRLVLTLGGIAYFVDLFLRWGPDRLGGWDLNLVGISGYLVVALLLVELVRSVGVWLTATSSLLTFFLAAGVGILGLSGLVHLRWGLYRIRFEHFGYGAWIGLVLQLALLVAAFLRLDEQAGWLAKRQGRARIPA